MRFTWMRYIIKKYVRKVIARSSRCFTMLLRTYFGAALLNNLTFRFEHHAANYRGWAVHKQLQQKLYPKLRDRYIPRSPTNIAPSGPTPAGITYAKATQGRYQQSHSAPVPPPPQTESQQTNEITELRRLMTNLTNQMGTLINLITALISKTDKWLNY